MYVQRIGLALDALLDLVDQLGVQLARLDGGERGLNLTRGQAAIEIAGDGFAADTFAALDCGACAS
jgi:hypothetical protein